MNVKSSLIAVALALALAGCAHSKQEKGGDAADTSEDVAAIKKRAVGDLNCSGEIKVEVVEEGNMWRPWTFMASGCGQHANYLSRMGTIIRN